MNVLLHFCERFINLNTNNVQLIVYTISVHRELNVLLHICARFTNKPHQPLANCVYIRSQILITKMKHVLLTLQYIVGSYAIPSCEHTYRQHLCERFTYFILSFKKTSASTRRCGSVQCTGWRGAAAAAAAAAARRCQNIFELNFIIYKV